jgi:hypothetical protein
MTESKENYDPNVEYIKEIIDKNFNLNFLSGYGLKIDKPKFEIKQLMNNDYQITISQIYKFENTNENFVDYVSTKIIPHSSTKLNLEIILCMILELQKEYFETVDIIFRNINYWKIIIEKIKNYIPEINNLVIQNICKIVNHDLQHISMYLQKIIVVCYKFNNNNNNHSRIEKVTLDYSSFDDATMNENALIKITQDSINAIKENLNSCEMIKQEIMKFFRFTPNAEFLLGSEIIKTFDISKEGYNFYICIYGTLFDKNNNNNISILFKDYCNYINIELNSIISQFFISKIEQRIQFNVKIKRMFLYAIGEDNFTLSQIFNFNALMVDIKINQLEPTFDTYFIYVQMYPFDFSRSIKIFKEEIDNEIDTLIKNEFKSIISEYKEQKLALELSSTLKIRDNQ